MSMMYLILQFIDKIMFVQSLYSFSICVSSYCWLEALVLWCNKNLLRTPSLIVENSIFHCSALKTRVQFQLSFPECTEHGKQTISHLLKIGRQRSGKSRIRFYFFSDQSDQNLFRNNNNAHVQNWALRLRCLKIAK